MIKIGIQAVLLSTYFYYPKYFSYNLFKNVLLSMFEKLQKGDLKISMIEPQVGRLDPAAIQLMLKCLQVCQLSYTHLLAPRKNKKDEHEESDESFIVNQSALILTN